MGAPHDPAPQRCPGRRPHTGPREPATIPDLAALVGRVHAERHGLGERSNANALADMWAESDRRFRARRRLALDAGRYRWHVHLCEHIGRPARDHEAKAEALLEHESERSNT